MYKKHDKDEKHGCKRQLQHSQADMIKANQNIFLDNMDKLDKSSFFTPWPDIILSEKSVDPSH